MYVFSRIIVGLPDVLVILASPAALALSGEATAIGTALGAPPEGVSLPRQARYGVTARVWMLRHPLEEVALRCFNTH